MYRCTVDRRRRRRGGKTVSNQLETSKSMVGNVAETLTGGRVLTRCRSKRVNRFHRPCMIQFVVSLCYRYTILSCPAVVVIRDRHRAQILPSASDPSLFRYSLPCLLTQYPIAPAPDRPKSSPRPRPQVRTRPRSPLRSGRPVHA